VSDTLCRKALINYLILNLRAVFDCCIQSRMSTTYKSPKKAAHHVLGEEHLYTLECMSELGCVYITRRHYQEAEGLLKKALEIARRNLGEGHPLTLRFVNGLAIGQTRPSS